MTTGRAPRATRRARTIDLSTSWNATDAEVGARFHPMYRAALPRLPDGSAVLRGLPFSLGTRAAGRRWILASEVTTVELPGSAPASHLVVAHFSDSWRDTNGDRAPGTPVGWVLPTGEPLGRYELTFADGERLSLDMRRRFEIADGIIGWGFVPFAAVSHRADEVLDWRGPYPRQAPGRYAPAGHGGALTVLPGAWGANQTGVADAVPSPDDDVTYWLHAIPLPPNARPIRLTITPLGDGRPGTGIVIAGLTLFDGTADPLLLTARRQILVEGMGDELPTVDLGFAIASRPWRAPGAGDERGPIGWGQPATSEPVLPTGLIVDLALAADASIDFGGWTVPAADLDGPQDGRRGGMRIEPLPAPDVRLEVTVSADGSPSPARVRFVAADGRYLPPLGHREELNPAVFEDTGAGVVLGGDTYAYVPGTFSIDLPVGPVNVEVVKGFDHRPLRTTITVERDQRELRLGLDRAIDLRAEGWVAADPHVHFIAPSTALLQAAAEDITFVHLLATQLGDAYTNVTDLGWGSQAAPDGRHVVMVGTENRQNVLGHLALLGARRPVLPMASGGAPEGRIGAPLRELLADWADRCHAEGGLVVGAHFPLPLAEIAANIVAGRIDAIEMQTFAPGLDNPTVHEWYRFLNCGYRLPVLGGTDKMSAEMVLGGIRTYARLDPDAAPTFEAWAGAVRAGRTFATSGPVIELSVDGHEPGAVVSLPPKGGHLQAVVRARAAQPVIACVELVVNGRVVASREAVQGTDDLELTATVEVDSSAWIAARSRSEHEVRSAYLTSMAAHTSPVYVEVPDRPLFDRGDADAIGAVIDGTVRWLETIATIDDPGKRARMVARIRESGVMLRQRGDRDQMEVS